MKNIYDEIGPPSILHHKKICKLTEPLQLCFGIDRFWRNSHRTDGSYAVLGNYPPIAEAFFGQNLFKGHPYFRHPRFFQSGVALPELLHSQEYEATQGRLRSDGDCYHVLIHIRKEENGFVEYGFATSQQRVGFEAVYLNHLPAITKFIEFFEESGSKLICEADRRRINMAELIGAKYHEKPQLTHAIQLPDRELRFLAALEQSSEKEKAILSLTKSERACLRLYLSGLTMLEVAKRLYRSPRTIESHLEHAKAKLGVTSRARLFERLAPFRELL